MEFEWLVFVERHGHIGTHLLFPYYLYEPKHPSLDLSQSHFFLTCCLIDLFIVFNATFSNISAVSWRPLRVECTLFVIYKAVLVIGLYELLGNSTT
jgi:hypothetical protein